MTKVIFSNFPWYSKDEKGNLQKGVRAGSRWPNMQPALCKPDQWCEGMYLCAPLFMAAACTYTAKHTGATCLLRDSVALNEGYASFYRYLQAEGPDFIVIESATPCWDHDKGIIARIAGFCPEAKIVICGPIAHPASGKQDEILALPGVVAVIAGEYEKGCVRVVNGQTGKIPFEMLTKEEMNAAPFPWQEASMIWRYHDACPHSPLMPQAQVYASRGCNFRCLSGDTPINTVYGMIPIKELAETRESVGVFTYDAAGKRGLVSTARNIMKTGEGRRLVRVHFDDGTHIDCTPDHRFLAFKWGNQHVGETEWESEAKDLQPGTHLRALKFNIGGAKNNQYKYAGWSRYGVKRVNRMVGEWKAGRPLLRSEHVHHIDRNKFNDAPENLKITASAKEHLAEHPEIAERMRTNNPAKNMTPEWRAKITAAVTGKKRTPESKERYRLAAIKREAAKSPEQKQEDARKMHAGIQKKKHGKVLNHRVAYVEELVGVHDVYCMEVPETGWFYANNVLVHNCNFCSFPAVMTNDDPTGTEKRSVRFYTPEYMEAYLSHLVKEFRVRSVYFDDDTFNLGNKHVAGICAVMKKLGLPWAAMCRADTVKWETWELMAASGCYGVKIGFESGVQAVVDRMGKDLNITEARKTVIKLRNLGLSVHTTWTLGHPGETKEQMQATMEFIKTVPHNSLQISGTALLDGTPNAEEDKIAGLPADYNRTPEGNAKLREIWEQVATQ